MPASYSLAPNVEGGVAACSGAFSCLEAIAGSLVALLLWAGLSTGLLFAPRANVRAALAALRKEREAIVAEQDALNAFATRIKELPAAGPAPTVEAGSVGVVSAANSQPHGMAKVQEVYRETLMDVEHYDRDYGESLPENLAKEFGDGIAGAVLANDGLSPQVKRALLTSAKEGHTRRGRYLETLDRERARLDEAGDSLETAAACCDAVDGNRLRRRSFEDLQNRYERLDDGRESLTAMLQQRQKQLREGVTFGWQRRDSESVYRYLYRNVDATYPVLADGTCMLQRMDEIESDLTTALTARI